jgi:hypothetical protein
MDNCSPHTGEAVIALLTDTQIRVVTFATHITQIFQVLDVVLFGALKKHATNLTMLDEEQSAAAFLIKVYHDYKQTMVETYGTVAPLSIFRWLLCDGIWTRQCRMVGRLMNWKEYARKRSWPNRDTIPVFAWRNWGKL